MKTWSHSIPGPRDEELGLDRPSLITYHGTAPDGPAQGLVFVLHGFGQDTNAEYDQKLREHVTQTYHVATVTVEYHCYRSRPALGAQIHFTPEAAITLEALSHQWGVPLPAEPSALIPWLETLGRRLPQRTEVRAQLVPPNGDYQNFGVLQALDHLYVLEHLCQEKLDFDRRRIGLFGSSHGGYLAHLLHKFAPNTFSMLLDNSGYTRANRIQLGQAGEFFIPSGQLLLACSVVTRWTFSNVYSPDYFGIAPELIRHTAFQDHLGEMARVSAKPCRIRMINSEADQISPVGAKIRQHEAYQAFGFDSELTRFGNERGVPDYVKSLEHGDVSLRKLFDHWAPGLLEFSNPSPPDAELGTELRFDCIEATYVVKHSAQPPGVTLRIERPSPIRGA